MKRNRIWVLGLVALATLSGCKDNPLKSYVEQSVKLNVVGADARNGTVELAGNIEFKNTTTWTAYRNVCDTQICGETREYVCRPETTCHPVGAPVCHGTLVDGRVVLPPGCNNNGQREHEQCDTTNVCGYELQPQYCQVNCRQEPYLDSSTNTTLSPVQILLRGKDSLPIQAKQVQALSLGINPNEKFQAALTDPGQRPRGFEYLFNDLRQDDRLVLVLKAKGLDLAPEQQIAIPPNFERGQNLSLEVEVVPNGDSKARVSAVGSTSALPDLQTYSNE